MRKHIDHVPRTRGLIAIPAGNVPSVTRCVQIQIPDSDAALRQLFGMMRQLTFWRNYERDSEHKATQWAQAWVAAIAAGMAACGVAIEFLQDDCGLSYREVGSETWIPIYDGLHCLESDGAHNLIDGYIGDYIDQAIADGVIQGGQIQTGPQNPPTTGGCNVYHVSLAPGATWHSPFAVQGGDTIHITNISGGWSIGELAWYCGDGARYLLGGCDENLKSHVTGDLLAAAWHMQVIGLFGTTYFDPVAASYTLADLTPLQDFLLMANTALTGVPSGEITFDVQICREGTWTHIWGEGYDDLHYSPYIDSDAGGVHTTVWNGTGWECEAGESSYYVGLKPPAFAGDYLWFHSHSPIHTGDNSYRLYSSDNTINNHGELTAPLTVNGGFSGGGSAEFIITAYTGDVHQIIASGTGTDPFV